jgi:Zn-dependent peptidase ImmA (M78 family)/transcriptional regulator with XRE-family HTH domain
MIVGDRVRQARESLGLTQTELAERLDVGQAMIAQLESGRRQPSADLLTRISFLTGYPLSFFRQPALDDFPMGSLLYRARTSVSARQRVRAFRIAQTYFECVKRLREQLDVPAVRLPRLREDAVTAAQLTRSALGLSPDGPVRNLVRVLERSGVIVLQLPLRVAGLDAFSAWPAHAASPPVIALLETTEGDRQRFSTAHEVGELVLHAQPTGTITEMDAEANAFAAELLLPAKAMLEEIAVPVTLGSLSELKLRWGVSIQALIRRARDLEIISDRQYRYLFEQLSAKGWRLREPENLRIRVETPRAFLTMVELLYGKRLDISRLAADLHHTEAFIVRLLESHGALPPPVDSGTTAEPVRFHDRRSV